MVPNRAEQHIWEKISKCPADYNFLKNGTPKLSSKFSFFAQTFLFNCCIKLLMELFFLVFIFFRSFLKKYLYVLSFYKFSQQMYFKRDVYISSSSLYHSKCNFSFWSTCWPNELWPWTTVALLNEQRFWIWIPLLNADISVTILSTYLKIICMN